LHVACLTYSSDQRNLILVMLAQRDTCRKRRIGATQTKGYTRRNAKQMSGAWRHTWPFGTITRTHSSHRQDDGPNHFEKL